MVPQSHPLGSFPAIQLEQLRDDAFITLEEDSKLHALFRISCQRAGFFPKISFTCNQVSSILDLVARGVGVALLMRGHTLLHHQPILVKELLPRVHTDVNLCYCQNRPLSPAARDFIRYAVSFPK